MLFDKLAGFIERHIPGLVPDLEQTALFEFPFRAHEAVTPGKFSQDDLDHFFLPFPRTAIEDKSMGLDRPSADTGGGKRPHERRRHWRLLQSERFTHKKGQRVLVDACGVGPSEAIVGTTRYWVRLDI